MKEFVESLPDDPVRAIELALNYLEEISKKFLFNGMLSTLEMKVEDRASIIVLFRIINSNMKKIDQKVIFDQSYINFVEGKINDSILFKSKLDYSYKILIPFKVRAEIDSIGVNFDHDGLSDPIECIFLLNQSEMKTVQNLLASVREIVFSSRDLDGKHKARILRRVSQVEKELLEPRSKLDIVLAAASDIGDTIFQLGNDAKPAVERMKEVADIARKNSSEVKLSGPEENPKLPSPDQDV